ncbi:hypothetical protein LLG90_04780 [Aromatoleum toluclasticum]|uniref:TubC N-terminal docking domain-related protein n=1 Tax=Aromatoleum toluclasticum TaxID=92003 RepID=UPI001D18AD0A|nr:hypothetical protein [Aromatoleum toluclasticum]MCC4114664.1 hypothetical protein [Aromatoleum toluclasticum]
MAFDILSELLAAGLTLTAVDGRLIVDPAGRITDEHRALIRAHKAELLDLLTTAESIEGHPLRQLPADQGVTCRRWEAQ